MTFVFPRVSARVYPVVGRRGVPLPQALPFQAQCQHCFVQISASRCYSTRFYLCSSGSGSSKSSSSACSSTLAPVNAVSVSSQSKRRRLSSTAEARARAGTGTGTESGTKARDEQAADERVDHGERRSEDRVPDGRHGAYGATVSRRADAAGLGSKTTGTRTADAAETDGESRVIVDEYAVLREKYATPKHPIVLAHGLLGFDELHPLGSLLPSVHYWRGITEALRANGAKVFTASVGPLDTIERRAAALKAYIAEQAPGEEVNVVAHSMGGLDARYMVSRLLNDNTKSTKPPFSVRSITTIGSPHRGSALADYMLSDKTPWLWHGYVLPNLPPVLGGGGGRAGRVGVEAARQSEGIATAGFGSSINVWTQLTQAHMQTVFNPSTPDAEGVRYFSYGAAVQPPRWSVFYLSERFIRSVEGANDGLVSVESSKWGEYKGTLAEVSHLDLINWSNRFTWAMRALAGRKRRFNAVAFYLAVADMLAKEEL